ncbi:MAG: DUF488 domain-containing protein [Coleofasciculaceae cyanobacterium RL_1_1]|nr:DUF488 domain-containing protein [Coleofasciculaceae cyanobacterium RL_1_1]
MTHQPLQTGSLFTFGYGNRTNYDQFEQYLTDNEIDLVVDVRLTPRAWTRTWYGDRIQNFCRSKKVRYVSEKRLGNTSKKKQWIPPNTEEAENAVKKLSKMALKRNILFLCAELKSERCHRTEVAERVGDLSNALVTHLA